MRKFLRLTIASTLASVAASLIASGFPRRSGLTKAQALVSMPGDLVLPDATHQADRAAHVRLHPQQVAARLDDLVQGYADAWNTPLEVVYDEPGSLLVLKTAPVEDSEGQLSQAAPVEASLAVRLVPEGSGMNVHVRERYRRSARFGKARIFATMADSVRTWMRWRYR